MRDLPESLWQDIRVVSPVTKQAISIRLGQDVLDVLRASDPRYQSQSNAVFRQYAEPVAEPVAATTPAPSRTRGQTCRCC